MILSSFNPISGYKKQGFTLIELLVVIAILAILAGAILTVLNPAKQRAKASQSGAKGLAKQACDNIAVCNIEDPAGVCGGTNLNPKVVPGCGTGTGACTLGTGGTSGLPAGVTLDTGWGVSDTSVVAYTSNLSGYTCTFSCDIEGSHTITATAPQSQAADKGCIID